MSTGVPSLTRATDQVLPRTGSLGTILHTYIDKYIDIKRTFNFLSLIFQNDCNQSKTDLTLIINPSRSSEINKKNVKIISEATGPYRLYRKSSLENSKISDAAGVSSLPLAIGQTLPRTVFGCHSVKTT